jgi:hypothetical protein
MIKLFGHFSHFLSIKFFAWRWFEFCQSEHFLGMMEGFSKISSMWQQVMTCLCAGGLTAMSY